MIYRHTHEIDGAVLAAQTIVPLVLSQVRGVKTVMDVGGGAGAWASAFKRFGGQSVLVQDHVSASQHLLVDKCEFEDVDFRNGFPAARRMDLVVCLEVAEHIPKRFGPQLVDYLSACSNRILFSAAVPGQGGVGHVNCRPHRYWLEQFENHGFKVYDSIRPLIATSCDIPFWYRQNLFLLTKSDDDAIFEPKFIADDMDLISKQVLSALERPSVRDAIQLLKNAIVKAFYAKTSR